jgi:hypothetical protein
MARITRVLAAPDVAPVPQDPPASALTERPSRPAWIDPPATPASSPKPKGGKS